MQVMTEDEALVILGIVRNERQDLLPPPLGTRRIYTIKTGTIFAKSSTPLNKWFDLLMVLDANKGISSYGASKMVGLRPSTIWSLMHRIKRAHEHGRGDLMDDIVKKIKEIQ